MTTVQSAYHDFIKALQVLHTEREAQSIARIVFEDAFQLFDYQSNRPFLQTKKLGEIQTRLLDNEPIQYILRQADFYGLKFKTTPDVLIPRPETEELVYWILETIQKPNASILDIGTGSGCIPIALKKKRPDWQITALDISKAALDIATENAALNKVAIDFKALHILQKKEWATLPKFEVIVSNPPYIPYREVSLMPKQVIDFEPNIALFVENEDPLIFYRTIGQFGLEKLTKDGQLFFECNEFNATKVVELLKDLGYKEVELQEDMEGKERMVRAKGD